MTWAAAHAAITADIEAKAPTYQGPGLIPAFRHDPQADADDPDGGLPGPRSWYIAAVGLAQQPATACGIYHTTADLILGAHRSRPDSDGRDAAAISDLQDIYGVLAAVSGGGVNVILGDGPLGGFASEREPGGGDTGAYWRTRITVEHT